MSEQKISFSYLEWKYIRHADIYLIYEMNVHIYLLFLWKFCIIILVQITSLLASVNAIMGLAIKLTYKTVLKCLSWGNEMLIFWLDNTIIIIIQSNLTIIIINIDKLQIFQIMDCFKKLRFLFYLNNMLR